MKTNEKYGVYEAPRVEVIEVEVEWSEPQKLDGLIMMQI